MKKIIFTLFAFTLFAFTTNAQISTPAPSTSATITQTVGLTDITVDYSRPTAKGRSIFAADGLVPFGQVWRTGANGATKITFSDDVTIGGKSVKKGSYAILTTPNASAWEFMLYDYTERSWSKYKDRTPAAKFSAKSQSSDRNVEAFTVGFNDMKDESANLEFSWANTYVAVPISVDADSKVMKDIEKAMAGTTAGEYYNAGSYYHKAGKDINQAYEWVHKANEMNGDSPKFWQLRREALILADMNRMGDAIAVATKSKDLAAKANNKDYVRMNEKSIAEWTSKAKAKGKVKKGQEGKKAAAMKLEKM